MVFCSFASRLCAACAVANGIPSNIENHGDPICAGISKPDSFADVHRSDDAVRRARQQRGGQQLPGCAGRDHRAFLGWRGCGSVGATEQQIADAVHIAIAARYEATVLEWAALA